MLHLAVAYKDYALVFPSSLNCFDNVYSPKNKALHNGSSGSPLCVTVLMQMVRNVGAKGKMKMMLAVVHVQLPLT